MTTCTQAADFITSQELPRRLPGKTSRQAPRLLAYLAWLFDCQAGKSRRGARYAVPRIDTIARALACSRRTVQYRLADLQAAGIIVTTHRWRRGEHRQTTNLYRPSRWMVSILRRLQGWASRQGGGCKPLHTQSPSRGRQTAGAGSAGAPASSAAGASPPDPSSGDARARLQEVRDRWAI